MSVELLEHEEAAVKQLTEARRKARKYARSGNPAKRVPARKTIAEASTWISRIFRRAAERADG